MVWYVTVTSTAGLLSPPGTCSAVTWSGAVEQPEPEATLGSECSSCATTVQAPPGSAEGEEAYRAAARAAFCTVISATVQKPTSATATDRKKIHGARMAS